MPNNNDNENNNSSNPFVIKSDGNNLNDGDA